MVCEKIRSRHSSERPYLFYYERGESIISSFSVGYAEDFSYGRDEPWGLRQFVILLYANVARYFYF